MRQTTCNYDVILMMTVFRPQVTGTVNVHPAMNHLMMSPAAMAVKYLNLMSQRLTNKQQNPSTVNCAMELLITLLGSVKSLIAPTSP